MKTAFFVIFALLVSHDQILAQDSKHPRVLEIENYLSEKAFQFIKGRFPDYPITVTAYVVPLRRSGTGGSVETDSLPYNILSEVSVVDEWDDPNLPLLSLLPRLREARIEVNLPTQVSDAEVLELKQSLLTVLGLINARDTVLINRRPWGPETSDLLPIDELAAPVALMAIGLIFLLLLTRYGTGRLTNAMSALPLSKNSGSSTISPMSAPVPRPSSQLAKSKETSVQGDFTFNDPIKIREHILESIKSLSESDCFPTLADMVDLDQLIEENQSWLGAVVFEFPKPVQDKIFEVCPLDWLEGFSNPGQLNLKCMEVIDRMASRDRDGKQSWEELLISVWRLRKKAADFFRQIDRKHALSILSRMPIGLSIPIGRQVLPGSWASLVNDSDQFDPPPTETIARLLMIAQALLPKNNRRMLESYRHQRELLKFLKTAPPAVEREVYEASSNEALIHTLRPPFFAVFALSEEQLTKVFQAFSGSEWAIALFNIPHDQRNIIKSIATDKQWYIVIDTLKTLDQQDVDLQLQGELREAIGRKVAEISDVGSVETIESKDTQQKDDKDRNKNEGHPANIAA